MQKIMLGLCLHFMLISSVFAQTQVPQFKDYPVQSVYTGKTAKLDLSDEDVRAFRTRLGDALKESPNFAGEYVVTMWGCGASCRMYSFMSKRTGKLLHAGFGGEGNQEDVIASKANSRLLVTQEENRNEKWELESLTVRFYVLEKGKFKLLKTVKSAAPKEES